jgi:cytochrome c oxidase assembly protein subunit 15
MNGSLIPAGIDWSNGVWNLLNNHPVVIHFIHRWWAWVTVGFLIVLARKIRSQSRPASIAIHSSFGIQIVVGIVTVLTSVNIVYAVLHQAIGALVVIVTTWGVHVLGQKDMDVT